MKKIIKDRKGSVGKEWIYALGFIFGLSLLYLMFNMIYQVHLAPIFIDNLPDNAVGADAENGILFYMSLFKIAPFILLGVVIIYMFLLAVKKEPVEREW